MPAREPSPLKLKIEPVTPKRWGDLETLFGERGACAGCWCMWWRLPRSKFVAQKGEGNRKALKRIVASGAIPGLIAYHEGEPIGWCALASRSDYPRLANSRILREVDEQPVWSITCFFVARPFRRRGVTGKLLEAAITYAKKRGARILEGYPVDAKAQSADTFVYTGLASTFLGAGFKEVARRSPTRPVMRHDLQRD